MVNKHSTLFTKFARWAALVSGKPATFFVAVTIIVAWAVTGPLFSYSDTWQLVINTGTTVITFLMVFLIQNTQNRDTEALQIKLDEIIRSLDSARNQVLDLEELDTNELNEIRQEYLDLAERARLEADAREREGSSVL